VVGGHVRRGDVHPQVARDVGDEHTAHREVHGHAFPRGDRDAQVGVRLQPAAVGGDAHPAPPAEPAAPFVVVEGAVVAHVQRRTAAEVGLAIDDVVVGIDHAQGPATA